MEKNSANLNEEWYIDQQITTELEKFNLLPHNEMFFFSGFYGMIVWGRLR